MSKSIGGRKLERAERQNRENEDLRERLSRLSEASLRITEDLDLDTVLREVVAGARTLTGARVGGMATLDHEGRLADFTTSSLSPEERQQFIDLLEGPEFFAHLSELAGPLRLADFSEYAQKVGLPEIGPPLGPVKTFLGLSIRHRGQHIGNLYLSDKQSGAEFTDEDEEILAMFASHAAVAIANARRYREERRARADLENLVDTSLTGVVVLDATAGALVSLNPEARRIIDALRSPGQPAEQLPDTLTFRRANGQEMSLAEFPFTEALRAGEKVRSEEIAMQVPDGRSVPVLVSAAPIHSDDGEVKSMVITLQDMAPLEELGRLRADFLAMVSHEMRAPLSSIKGSVAALIGSADSLDPAVALQFFRIIDEQTDHIQSLTTDLLDVGRIEAGMLSVSPESIDAAVLVDQARSAFLSRGERFNITIDLPLDLPKVMADRRRVVQVLDNLLTNAARHSPDTSAIRMAVARKDAYLEFSVADDGVGISAELLPLLFRKFSGANAGDRSNVAGSGLGLAICKGIVEAHGGRIWAESRGSGMGSRFTFTIPTDGETGYALPTERAARPAQSGRTRGRSRPHSGRR